MTATTRLATTPRTPDWDRALCAQTDPAIFFPEGKGQQVTKACEQAKRVCGRCPIQEGCREWALATRQPAGVWGGLDEHERSEVLGLRQSQVADCWERQEWIEEQLVAKVSHRQIAERLQVSRSALERALEQFEAERAAAAGMGVKAA